MTPKFVDQFHKITLAYFEDSLRPFSPCNCFIGHLLNNSSDWNKLRTVDHETKKYCPIAPGLLDPTFGFYSMEEICRIENNFLATYMDRAGNVSDESLFNAVNTTLDLLKEIHESRDVLLVV